MATMPTDGELFDIAQRGRDGFHEAWHSGTQDDAGRRALYEAGRQAVIDQIRARADEIDRFSFINPPDSADCDEAAAFRRAAAFAAGEES